MRRSMQHLRYLAVLLLCMPPHAALAEQFLDLRKEYNHLPPLMSHCDGSAASTYELIEPFCEDIQSRIGKVTPQPISNASERKQLICALTLTPKGEILDLRVATSSGSDEVDKTTEELIRNAAPFTVRLHFDKTNRTFWIVFFDYPNVTREEVYVKTVYSKTVRKPNTYKT